MLTFKNKPNEFIRIRADGRNGWCRTLRMTKTGCVKETVRAGRVNEFALSPGVRETFEQWSDEEL